MKFENSEYQVLIDKINTIRSYGLSRMITVPQIAIVGDQSSGKSSVLEALTKLRFPRNMEMCTCFATQVSMRLSKQVGMTAHIDNEPVFNKWFEEDQERDIEKIISKAVSILCPPGSPNEISHKVLEITISGPDSSPLTVIDLPGYINTTIDGQDKSIIKKIHDINTRYIQDPRTIVLAVVPAHIDLNNNYALSQAELYDPYHERTIPIVTKPDLVDPDLLPNLFTILQNKKKHMRLGYLVLRNSTFRDINKSWDDARQTEDDFFSSSPWDQLPAERKGRVGVKTFLGHVLYNHIKGDLPALKRDIQVRIGELEREIDGLGPQMTSEPAAKTQYHSCILRLQTALNSFLAGNNSLDYIRKHMSSPARSISSPIPGSILSSMSSSMSSPIPSPPFTASTRIRDGAVIDSDDDLSPLSPSKNTPYFRSTMSGYYARFSQVMNRDKYIGSREKIGDLISRYKGNELQGFVTFNTFTQIYLETTLVHWLDITKNHVDNMRSYLYDVVTKFIDFTAEPLLKDLLLIEFEKFYDLQSRNIAETIENIFDDEGSPFAMNEAYYGGVLQGKKARMEQQFNEHLQKVPPVNTKERMSSDHLRVSVDYNQKTAELAAADELYEQLRSYCEVARKRIVDVVLLQTIERFLIKRINVYFEMLIAVDSTLISSRLLDSPAKIASRTGLQSNVEVLRRSLVEL
ncbi:hypothetical protein BGZ99_001913 [Dissophora globulifera]|uniref:Uncharacterized protein n=1 Tax=Dissophora globulifera TaxID=979702 RepID=A0A9P6UIN9_9FUNG|nr:hypothetical protein BGZ99_001913 [Dissophora globulifera]